MQILGNLTSGLAKEGFDTSIPTTFSWERQIRELQMAFRQVLDLMPSAGEWSVLFEYVLPTVGQRIDCVILARDLIYVIEYKGGAAQSAQAALRQAQEYALNLLDFHEESRSRAAVPIAVGGFKREIPLDLTCEHQGTSVGPMRLSQAIILSFSSWGGKRGSIDASAWNISRYFPVPTIIQAASAVYAGHDVKDLARCRAGDENLESTQSAVAMLVSEARAKDLKRLIVITGVPGAGKTLAGLNVVQSLIQELNLDVDQASFLSGNGPLVAVLQEALKRSAGTHKKGAMRSIRSRIREMHRFVKTSYEGDRTPADRLIVFDEAQRAWTAAKNLKKFGYDRSEPELVLDIMGRHKGWAVIVALVGGGQEIHGGEAGLAAWGDAIAADSGWDVVTSPEALLGGPSVAGSRLFRDAKLVPSRVAQDAALHLAVSKRSYESDITAAWVNSVLDGQAQEAEALAARGLPVYLARTMDTVRSWLMANAKGNRRAGLIASSGAARLRADGVETPTFQFLRSVEYVKWFLEPAGDHRSSNQLEVAMSEFEMQGLEIDLAALLWGGDLLFRDGRVITRVLRGTRWCTVDGTDDPQASADDRRTRIRNKYRVLLTRFRKAMIIFVPMGSTIDSTRAQDDFDSIATYLVSCGAHLVAHSGRIETLRDAFAEA